MAAVTSHQPVFIPSVSEEALHTLAAHQAHFLKKALNLFSFLNMSCVSRSCCHMLFPHCCFSVLLTFVLSHHFLAVSCLNSTSLTSPSSSPSLVHSNAALIFWISSLLAAEVQLLHPARRQQVEQVGIASLESPTQSWVRMS